MDAAQLSILENKAGSIDAEIDAESVAGSEAAAGGQIMPPLREELADMLDMVAKAGSFALPTMHKHFNHVANLEIADNMIKLADKYGYDLRQALIGSDSPLMLFIGLAYSMAMPTMACIHDYKQLKAAAKAEQERSEAAGASVTVDTGRSETSAPINSVVTGAN